MNLPSYIKIMSDCTSGKVVREDIITDWYDVILEDNSIVRSYYHKFHGWMVKREAIGDFIYGYIPLTKKVISYNEKD